MRADLQKELFQKFPSLFELAKEGPRVSCMCFGFECGDGWYQLIHDLCGEIIASENGDQVRAVQVKEKFGGLRFYTNGADEYVHFLIEEAEKKSYVTCEDCGKPGKPRGGSWIRTLCDECDQKE